MPNIFDPETLQDNIKQARQDLGEATRNHAEAVTREREVVGLYAAAKADVARLEALLQAGTDDSLEATKEFPKRWSEFQELEIELKALQNGTVPGFERAKTKAEMQVVVYEVLSGTTGYLSPEEVGAMTQDRIEKIKELVKEVIRPVEESNKQVGAMHAAVEAAERAGTLDPHGRGESIHLDGSPRDPRRDVIVNGNRLGKSSPAIILEGFTVAIQEARKELTRDLYPQD